MKLRRRIPRAGAQWLLAGLAACACSLPAPAFDDPAAAGPALLQGAIQADAQPMRLAQIDAWPLPRAHHHQMLDSADDAGGGNNQINEHRPLKPEGRVYVNEISGSAVVKAWERNEVQITGWLGSGVDHLEVTGDPSSLSVVVKLPSHSHSGGESNLRLLVPEGAQVEMETVSADVSVQGIRGPLKVTTVSGDVGIDVRSPQVAVQTVSGDVTLIAPSAATQASTVSGDLHLSGLQGTLAADSVSGNLSIRGSAFSDLKLKSVSGDIGLEAAFAPQAVVTGETLSGTITLHLPADVSGAATIKSFSGDTQCDLPQTGSSSPRDHGKKHELVFGDGKGVSLQLSSFSGDVHIDPLKTAPAPAH